MVVEQSWRSTGGGAWLVEERWWRGLVRLVASQSIAREECKACSCVACGMEASQAATAQLAVWIAVGRLAFQARGGLCRRHEVCSCARLCARVLRLRAC